MRKWTAIAEIVALLIELTGALILAKEVWDKPLEVLQKPGFNHFKRHKMIVEGQVVAKESYVETFFARRSARQARIGFSLVATGILCKIICKIVETVY